MEKSPDVVVDIPRSTPAHIRARIIAGTIAFCEKRSVSTFDELLYQDQAKRRAEQRTAVTTIHRRHGVLAMKYRSLSYEQIKRAVRLNYGEDTLNALNLAESIRRS